MRCVSVSGLALASAALAWGHPAVANDADGPWRSEAGARELALGDAEVPRWRDVLARAAAEREGLSRAVCDAPVDTPVEDCAYPAWLRTIEALRGLEPSDQLDRVQRAVNRLRYVSDMRNWGVTDRWETPAEMLTRGGDCEGFALTKYFALRELGFPEAALRLAIVWDGIDREQHAVLVVSAGDARWVLDNKFEAPVPLAAVTARYRTLWSVSRDGATLSVSGFAPTGTGIRLTKRGTMLAIRARRRR